MRVSNNFRFNTQALRWDRGRPARYEHRRCEYLAECSTSDVLFAFRAHGGRDARGPSKELDVIQPGILMLARVTSFERCVPGFAT